MTEREGCALLKQRFMAAGLHIVEDHKLDEDGISVVLDGFDPTRRIGYEYITTTAGDRADFPPSVVTALEARMEKGDLFLFLVDEKELPGEDSLAHAADGFLAALRQRGRLP